MKKSIVFLIIFALLFLVVLLALNFVKVPEYKFAENTDQSFVPCAEAEYVYPPNKIAKLLQAPDENTVLVDIRSRHDYINGHLEGAKHIAMANILEKENFKFFKSLKSEGKQAILYGNDVIEANAPFMVLRQMGIENIGISCKPYQFFTDNDLNFLATTDKVFANNETPIADFASFVSSENLKAKEREEQKQKKAVKAIAKPIVKKIKKVVKPQPKPEPAPVEEDEGC